MSGFDFIIVGAGLFGATVARELTDAGHACLVLEKRDDVGGNCATVVRDGQITSLYGGHIFHTNDRRLWDYAGRFAEMRPYRHYVRAMAAGRVYSLPVNLATFQQLYGATTPAEALQILDQVILDATGDNLRDYCLRTIGPRLYRLFIEGYTSKMWGRDPADLPAAIVRRLPVRFTWDESYFSDTYQGLPAGGYTPMVQKMLEGIDVRLGVDYLAARGAWPGAHIVYSGPLDELFDRDQGALEYRGLRFAHTRAEQADVQGCPTMNYPDLADPRLRVEEWRHWWPPASGAGSGSWITTTTPAGDAPMYPINDERNNRLAQAYRARAAAAGITVGGRLGTYRYYDMHQVLAEALAVSRRLIDTRAGRA